MQKFAHFFKKRGLLVAAALCTVAAGVAGVNVVNRMIDSLDTTQPPSTLQDTPAPAQDEIVEAPVGKPQTGVKVEATDPTAGQKPAADKNKADSKPAQESAAAADTPAPDAAAQPAPPRFARPVAGQVTAAFSGAELLYDVTMDDWRTHNGTDFAAVYGETVCSITAGTVKAVYEDVLWGWTVEVEAPEGLLRYTGLAHKPAVKQGAQVAMGDALGKLDELSAEIALDPHLHVEYEKDGKLADVMTLLAQ